MSPDRLRTPPDERLAAPVQLVDLPATSAALQAEPHAAVAGHRQIAVYRRGPVTLVSFLFETGGSMHEHQTDGVVTIDVRSGHLAVIANGMSYELMAGQLLALAPNVSHTVEARAPSEMLLTVHRTPADRSL